MFISGRIAKFIAAAGIASRRQAEKIIVDGRVKIDGQVITNPAINVSLDNVIMIDNKIIQAINKTRIWLYHKPSGLITTHNDPQNRPTIFDSLKNHLPKVIAVGRLDLNSEGLLLLTNSGTLARKFELPKNNFERIYKVRAHGNISKLMRFINKDQTTSITINHITYSIKKITLLSQKSNSNLWFEVTLTEGKNREIRKIFEYFSLKVNRLIRIRYGKYKLGNLKAGEFKEINYN